MQLSVLQVNEISFETISEDFVIHVHRSRLNSPYLLGMQ